MIEIEVRLALGIEYRETEELSRLAFWNNYFPGADAHYLLHMIREHSDFIPELDLVAVHGNRIVGNIVYTRSSVLNGDGNRIATATFGPISVHPDFQRQGIGSRLIEHSLKTADSMGFPAVIIYGNPSNYVSSGFSGSRKWGIANPEGRFPCALLVRELSPLCFGSSQNWCFHESPVFGITPEAVLEFDQNFSPLEKGWSPRQEEFTILSRAFLD